MVGLYNAEAHQGAGNEGDEDDLFQLGTELSRLDGFIAVLTYGFQVFEYRVDNDDQADKVEILLQQAEGKYQEVSGQQDDTV